MSRSPVGWRGIVVIEQDCGVGGFGVECTIGVTGLEFLLCGQTDILLDLALGALAPGSEPLFFCGGFSFGSRLSGRPSTPVRRVRLER